MNIGLVILAAGASSRMGSPKQLLPIFGTSLIKHLISEAFETKCHPIIVVVGANKPQIVPELVNMPIFIADNAAWETGMGSSIRMGLVGSYMHSKALDALIFITSDMPHVNAKFIDKLINKSIENPSFSIVASKYNDILGIPVLFKRIRFEDILDLKGESGAKSILEKYPEEIAFVDFELGKIDLDTKEDYYDFINSKN